MRPPPRRALRFALALAVSAAIVAGAACSEGPSVGWICLNPVTGKEDGNVGDTSHYTGGVYDPCFCYGPCGPSKECPISIDAGQPPPGCDAGSNAGTGGSGP